MSYIIQTKSTKTTKKSPGQIQMTQRPNILFCIADDQSWPHASAYGCPWVNTPAFDRVAREGLLFKNAFTQCQMRRRSSLVATKSNFKKPADHLIYRTLDLSRTFQNAGYATVIHRAGHRANRELIDGSPRKSHCPEHNVPQSPHRKHCQYRLAANLLFSMPTR